MKTYIALAFFVGLIAGMFLNAVPMIEEFSRFTDVTWMPAIVNGKPGIVGEVHFKLPSAKSL